MDDQALRPIAYNDSISYSPEDVFNGNIALSNLLSELESLYGELNAIDGKDLPSAHLLKKVSGDVKLSVGTVNSMYQKINNLKVSFQENFPEIQLLFSEMQKELIIAETYLEPIHNNPQPRNSLRPVYYEQQPEPLNPSPVTMGQEPSQQHSFGGKQEVILPSQKSNPEPPLMWEPAGMNGIPQSMYPNGVYVDRNGNIPKDVKGMYENQLMWAKFKTSLKLWWNQNCKDVNCQKAIVLQYQEELYEKQNEIYENFYQYFPEGTEVQETSDMFLRMILPIAGPMASGGKTLLENVTEDMPDEEYWELVMNTRKEALTGVILDIALILMGGIAKVGGQYLDDAAKTGINAAKETLDAVDTLLELSESTS